MFLSGQRKKYKLQPSKTGSNTMRKRLEQHYVPALITLLGYEDRIMS